MNAAHDSAAIVLGQVRTVDEARRAASASVDVVTAQGTEAGGHTGLVSTLALVPAVVDAAAPIPVLAAGGIGWTCPASTSRFDAFASRRIMASNSA